jgi:hypothetical protein
MLAKIVTEKQLSKVKDDVAFIGVYHIPPLEEEPE